ncbi:cysteine--tRNA ligase [Estrella lausannensis]|uniref:Cysteine--tRNA ligase n=1 Tax=Estrella lausannensis TaxID=483423 RepID=A0A0H5DPJ2_9BACT|nr:cysteine--tRNA ligase [Estrella lausannensis]CRX38486.1 cysteinyl-tRNA synthetase [Estrella lausannensis]
MKTPLSFFNTLTRKKEPLKTVKEGEVTLYTCGPTVYNYAHIGNFRCYMFEDTLRRTIKLCGYRLKHVMNITDVDDKTIKGAIKEGVSLEQYTEKYTNAFFNDLDALNIERADAYPKATAYIDEMVRLIEILIEKQVAYKGGDGSIYFAIEKFPGYGKLSHLHLDELKAGASDRVHHDEYEKDHAADFVLWKAYDEERDGPLYWDSPFGKGRPGWHIECSAMAMKLLGDSIDIHCGGVDNMFPHHENEIAQSEACTGCSFAGMWLHAEHLIVDGKKMSKSLGNFFTLRDLLEKGYSGRQIRYLLMQTHYRTQLNFTMQGLDAAQHSLARLDAFVDRLESIDEKDSGYAVEELLGKAELEFKNHLADDLNISAALATLFDLVREINALIDQGKIGLKEAQNTLSLLKLFDGALGVLKFQLKAEVPKELEEALENRAKARQNKDWKRADEIRDFIHSKGYIIEDSPKGAKLKKVEAAHG